MLNKWLTYPQSTKGSDGYPPSGGGFSDGGRFPSEIPELSLIMSPDDMKK